MTASPPIMGTLFGRIRDLKNENPKNGGFHKLPDTNTSNPRF
jgi:hypothetical protein